jgi:hypothetical protein
MIRRSEARLAAVPALALLAVLAVLAAAAGCGGRDSLGPVVGPSTAPATTSQAPAGLPRSEPVTIEIPKIGVRAPVGRVGLTQQGTIEVPSLEHPELTGWYVNGPTPGEPGPAVILGHVDSKAGPAVFFRLSELRAGDPVTVARTDGSSARFLVTAVEQVPKSSFPTERVYGDLDHPGLRLITCGGGFDRDQGSYQDNVVVYADLDHGEWNAGTRGKST